MRQPYAFNNTLTVGLGLFVFLFAVLALCYRQYDALHHQQEFDFHARAISANLWALNETGITSYLTLAAQVGHYREFSVQTEREEEFLAITLPPPQSLDGVLYRLHLITLHPYQTDIIHDQEIIGSLKGTRYVRLIYPLAHLFLFLLLLTLTVLFILHLVDHRNRLQLQVLERTRKYWESERRYHALVNLLPEMVWEADQTGQITSLNEVARQYFCDPNQDETDRTCLEMFSPASRSQAKSLIEASLKGNDHGLNEFSAVDWQGREFPVLVRCIPRHVNGRVKGILGIIIDISERQVLEEQLHRALKMEAMGLMASGVAHDLNNILSGMINYPEVILNNLTVDEKARTYVEGMRKSGLRAAEVVADLLTIARGMTATKVPTNPNHLIVDSLYSPEFLHIRALHPDISYHRQLDEQIMPIHCSPVHVRKCLLNLITNAAEAIDGSGEIRINSENRRINHALPPSTLRSGWYSVISVNDNGGGISAADRQRIFEPFYTKKVMGRSGTGLGLVVVWNTMQDHGGEVQVHSDAHSTTFELLFPSTPMPVAFVADRDAIPGPPHRGQGQTILVVDDEPQQREISKVLLESLGYRVHTVSSGEEAVAWIGTNAADLVMIDMLMPPGINGRQTYERILAISPRQKAIIVSGFAEDQEVRAALDLGAGAFLLKPYTQVGLSQLIHEQLVTTHSPHATPLPQEVQP